MFDSSIFAEPSLSFFLSVVFSLLILLLNGFDMLHDDAELTILLLFKSWNALLEGCLHGCHILAYLAKVGLESSFRATIFDLSKDNAVIDSRNLVGDICTAWFNGTLSYRLHCLEVAFPSRNIRLVIICDNHVQELCAIVNLISFCTDIIEAYGVNRIYDALLSLFGFLVIFILMLHLIICIIILVN